MIARDFKLIADFVNEWAAVLEEHHRLAAAAATEARAIVVAPATADGGTFGVGRWYCGA